MVMSGSRRYVSWPVSSPFAIFHTDLWVPGYFTDSDSNVSLMNIMCDMTQFVVIVPVPDETLATLAEYFMQDVLSKFVIFHRLMLDGGSPFKDVFTAMCKSLNINYDALAKRNHKGLLVENFHRFINMAITIAAEDRETSDLFVAAGVAAGYAWNSSPIDGTDILRSIYEIDRELRFPLDIDLRGLPPPPPPCVN